MFIIDYNKNKYILTIDLSLDNDEFEAIYKFLLQRYIFYKDGWEIPPKRIDEMLLWFERYEYAYILTNDARKALEEYKNSFREETEFFRNATFDKSVLKESIAAYNYQIDAINWRLKRSSYLDAYDAGLGKTFINICVFSQLYKEQKVDGIIIIVPIGLSFHWQRQILNFVNIFNEKDIQIINNEEKIQPFKKYQNKKILIIRQDLIAHVIASYNKNYKKGKSLKNFRWTDNSYIDIKKEWNKDKLLLLIDEAHSIKHYSSLKTKALFSIKKYFKYKALLTATPSINEFANMYSLIKMIDNSIIPYSENAFRIWISESIGNKWSLYNINEYNTSNVQKVMKDYSTVFTQIRKEDIEELKTKKIIKTIECDLTELQKKIYKIIVEQELHVLQEEYDVITWKLFLNKLHLILEVFDNPLLLKKRYYDNQELQKYLNQWKIEDDPKFIYLKEKIQNICDEQNKKIIIYDIHPDSLELLSEKFKQYNPLTIHGELKVKDKEKDRTKKEDLFNYDKKHKIIFLSLYTSSAGINLQYGSNNILIYTLAWDATLFKQGQDRTMRINSKYDSYIELLYYPLSIDNLRLQKNFNRIELNNKLDKKISEEELKRLLHGEIY